MTTDTTPLPLTGIRIIEMGHTVMGPSCSVVFADLGADVIKVEPPEGERTRHNVGFGSGLFPLYNRNKRSLCLDLKSDAGRAILTKLITTSDALVENFAHGTMERLGFGWSALSKINPRLIYCALKGFLNGPYEHRPALDEVVQYMGGLAYMTALARGCIGGGSDGWHVWRHRHHGRAERARAHGTRADGEKRAVRGHRLHGGATHDRAGGERQGAAADAAQAQLVGDL
jgi:hypothetical protein